MNSKVGYVFVGLFVLLLGAAFVGGILWLSAGRPGKAYDEYVVYVRESVAGLSLDSAVKYHGVDVGVVREIGLAPHDPEQVRLFLQIDTGTSIREDTVATLESQGLTGLAYINLSGGSIDSPPLRAGPGEEYPVIKSRRSLWGRLDRSLMELADNLIDASKQINLVLSEENRRHLSEILQHLDALSGALNSRSETLVRSLDDLAEILHNARLASERLPDLVQRFEKTALAMEGMAKEVGSAGSTIRNAVAARNEELQGFTTETLPEVGIMVDELREAAENLRRFSAELERNPAILLQGLPTPPPGPGE
ncbi:MAG TPA: MCE family protein [Chromatiales bacterium]|nr:MCE family protein [Chromatiales bacterium]